MRTVFWAVFLAAILQAACGKKAETDGSHFEYLEDAQRKCWRISNDEWYRQPWNCEDKR